MTYQLILLVKLSCGHREVLAEPTEPCSRVVGDLLLPLVPDVEIGDVAGALITDPGSDFNGQATDQLIIHILAFVGHVLLSPAMEASEVGIGQEFAKGICMQGCRREVTVANQVTVSRRHPVGELIILL